MRYSAEQEAFLVAFHDRRPGATSRAFGRGRVEGGGSSYDMLAVMLGGVEGPALDLGCGDGYLLERLGASGPLIGVDLSAGELAAARRRGVDALLVRARAQQLPLADGSVCGAVSHFAFMLMAPADAVVAELGRVLASGAPFVTVVGGGPCEDDAFELFLELLRELRPELPAHHPRLGELRARDPDGLRALFCQATGFDEPEIRAAVMRLDGRADEVWDSLHSVYDLHHATDEQMSRLRAAFVAAACERWDDAAVPCAMRVRFVSTRRL